MYRNRFLPDILTTLFDRRRTARRDDDGRGMIELCHGLLSAEGEVSGHKLAEMVLARYRNSDDAEKLEFFLYLNDQLEIDATALAALAQDFAATGTVESYARVFHASTGKRRKLLRRLNQPSGATADLVAMRVDLLRLMRTQPDLARTDLDFSLLLRSWFNLGFLVMKQIDWMAPAELLDKIVAYEAVHAIDDLDDLRRRLSPPDRRCFAFFHPSMPDEPLIFVEVALTDHIPGSVDDILSEDRTPLLPEQAQVAVFYSISNCQQGLKGISFGNLLIKQVVAQLSMELPHLTHFVTLSPIPRLMSWLSGQIQDNTHGPAATAALNGEAHKDDIRTLAARYLLNAKQPSGAPFDPVARFHLGNGAEIFDVHADADSSCNGLTQSGGAMVNYLYDLKRVEGNHEDFALHGRIAASRGVKSLAQVPLKTQHQELAT